MAAAASAPEATAVRRLALSRALAGGAPDLYPVRFRAEVIDRYRAMPGVRLVRTRSVGRVALPRRWALDVGIDDEAGEVSVTLRGLAAQLPAEEREHWLRHLADEPGSAAYLRMQLAAGACIDDGESGDWE